MGFRTCLLSVSLLLSSCFALNMTLATEPAKIEDAFSHVSSYQRPELVGANRIAISADGSHVYCAAWRGNTIVAFEATEGGALKHLESYRDASLQGVIKLALNQDDSLLACICLRSSRICMFERNPKSGALTPSGLSNADLKWPVAIAFSPDSRFLYVADAGGSGTNPSAESQIVVFELSGKETVAEIARYKPEDCLGMRNVMVSADGMHCYACCSTSGNIFVFSRDKASGKLSMLQKIEAENSNAKLLDGVHTAALGQSGERLYSISGRFRGESGVTVFDRLRDGRLAFAREISVGSDGFEGGNDIIVSADESTIVASGTKSDSVVVIEQKLESGELRVTNTVSSSDDINLRGASGLLFGPKENTLFVAAEDGAAVTSFVRKLARGTSAPRVETAESHKAMNAIPNSDASQRTKLQFLPLTGTPNGTRVLRTKVPGGWLVLTERTDARGGGGITFVPDPDHSWDGYSVK